MKEVGLCHELMSDSMCWSDTLKLARKTVAENEVMNNEQETLVKQVAQGQRSLTWESTSTVTGQRSDEN